MEKEKKLRIAKEILNNKRTSDFYLYYRDIVTEPQDIGVKTVMLINEIKFKSQAKIQTPMDIWYLMKPETHTEKKASSTNHAC